MNEKIGRKCQKKNQKIWTNKRDEKNEKKIKKIIKKHNFLSGSRKAF